MNWSKRIASVGGVIGAMTTLVVETFNEELDDWEEYGLIYLNFGASYYETEHALSKIGIYMPRGSDTLQWGDFGLIREYGDKPAVRLFKSKDR